MDKKTIDNPLDLIIKRFPIPSWQPAAWLIMAFLTVGVIWSYYAKIDTVAFADGEVIPKGSMKIVQHLEGGVIEIINVKEGDKVKKGQSLLLLDPNTSMTNKGELEVRLDGFILRKYRLKAEVLGNDLIFPNDIVSRRPNIAQAEMQNYINRLQTLKSNGLVFLHQLEQRQQEIKETDLRIKALKSDIKLAKQQYTDAKSLFKNQLVTKLDLITMEREIQSIDSQIEISKEQLPRIEAALAEVEERLISAKSTFKADAANEMGQVQLEISRHEKLLNRANQEASRMEIFSPIDGIIKTMIHNTVGGVIRPGEPILEIIPTGDSLVIQAKIKPVDIGHVIKGMPATVKVNTYNFIRYGSLDGRIISIAADIEKNKNGDQYFIAIIKTDKSYLENNGLKYNILPGMQTVVDIHLGDKTVMDFLLKPILKMKHESFRER